MAYTLLRHLLGGIAIICVALPLCFGEASSEKTGIGIFDTLFLTKNAGLRIHGDLYLTHAHVIGAGKIIIQAKSSGKIVSHESQVNHLEISTPSKVHLEGVLAVNQSLIVQFGLFDLSAGKLEVSDSTVIQVLNGARIESDTKVAGLPLQNSHPLSVDFKAKAILASYVLPDVLFSGKTRQCFSHVIRSELQAYKDEASVPPEELRGIRMFL